MRVFIILIDEYNGQTGTLGEPLRLYVEGSTLHANLLNILSEQLDKKISEIEQKQTNLDKGEDQPKEGVNIAEGE